MSDTRKQIDDAVDQGNTIKPPEKWKTGDGPVTIRFNPQRTEATLEPEWEPRLRAAA